MKTKQFLLTLLLLLGGASFAWAEKFSPEAEILYRTNGDNTAWNPGFPKVASESNIEFEMKYPVSDFADKEYVIELFALGMAIAWLNPKVDSLEYTIRALGGKEEKNLQNPYKEMQARLDKLEYQFSRKLASHGYINNSYIRGE